MIISENEMGTVASVERIYSQMIEGSFDNCIAVGGGSILDAAKVAKAAHTDRWLLDPTVWSNAPGVLPKLETAGGAPWQLVAISTRPGSAAQIAPRACLRPHKGASGRLVAGNSLLPTIALVDPCAARTMRDQEILETICEIFFRLAGPLLITETSTAEIDQYSLSLVARLTLIAGRLQDGLGLDPQLEADLEQVSMLATVGWHTQRWEPGIHPWWCIQNTLCAKSGLTKGQITSHAFTAITAGFARRVLLHAHHHSRMTLADRLEHFFEYVSARNHPTIAVSADRLELSSLVDEVESLWPRTKGLDRSSIEERLSLTTLPIL